ncbi:MAG: DUF222 domain-containing protein [Rhodoglobus sp.]
MNEALHGLGEAKGLLSGAARAGVVGLDDSTLVLAASTVEEVGRLVDALRIQLAGELDERSRYELGRDGLAQRLGETRAVHLIEKVTRVSSREAARRVRLGRATRVRFGLDGSPLPADFPAVSNALSGGMLGLDSAAVIVQHLTQAASGPASLRQLDRAEAALVDAATTESADLVAVRARVWREALDPDGAEPRGEELRRRRAFWLGRETDGLTKFGGYADPVNAALLRAAVAERTGPNVQPRFLDDDEIAAAALNGQGMRDPRTPEQRNFDIVFGLLSAGIRSSEGKRKSMRSLTTVIAVVNKRDLDTGAGIGWLDDTDEPVPVSTIAELACDAGVRTIVLGDHGEPLYLGRTERLFSKAQRLALAVRDGGCVWNGCHAPPGWCHAHHVIEHRDGGATDIDNGTLLCPAHHHALHASDYQLRMVQGRPHLLAPPWLDPAQAWQPLGKSRVGMVA